MRTESIERGCPCGGRHGVPRPRIVTSGNHASSVTLLSGILAGLPEARLHALNAQRDLPVLARGGTRIARSAGSRCPRGCW